ncbi:hypothetical protein O181_060005 [Austropuccinia psidii MF-1]|uniref:Uncharacterized protein n=1 Tax=Austropuccinia psidii MF-1 TaxID=1389203 RepID=A0A9Q3ECJ8_9BASI|nr:hypothetical protein [Austropuccinia psidii MF-1]
MAVQHSPPATKNRSQKHQVVLTATASAPLDRTPSVHQLGTNWVRGTPMEEEEPSIIGGVKPRRSGSSSGLLCAYPVISHGPRSRLEGVEDEVEESEATEV